jgi:hypothetical protein
MGRPTLRNLMWPFAVSRPSLPTRSELLVGTALPHQPGILQRAGPGFYPARLPGFPTPVSNAWQHGDGLGTL